MIVDTTMCAVEKKMMISSQDNSWKSLSDLADDDHCQYTLSINTDDISFSCGSGTVTFDCQVTFAGPVIFNDGVTFNTDNVKWEVDNSSYKVGSIHYSMS